MSQPLAAQLRTDRPPFSVAPDDPRLPMMREAVAQRLRRLCTNMPAAEFEVLVRDVAVFHLRWFPETPPGPERDTP